VTPNRPLQLTSHSAFQSTSGRVWRRTWLLRSSAEALWLAAERPVRWAARAVADRRDHRFTAVIVAAGAVGCATALDYFFTGFSGWLIALLIALPILAWLISAPSKPRFLALLCIVAWSAVLPSIPWHDHKRFYMDCGRIHPGTPIEQVRSLMAPYHLQYDAVQATEPRSDGLALLFHPSLSRSADWCLVYGEDSVARVEISPD